MTRSLKKGPFVASQVMEAVEKMNETGKKDTIKTWSRSSTILPNMIGHTFAVYNNGHELFWPALQKDDAGRPAEKKENCGGTARRDGADRGQAQRVQAQVQDLRPSMFNERGRDEINFASFESSKLAETLRQGRNLLSKLCDQNLGLSAEQQQNKKADKIYIRISWNFKRNGMTFF